MPVWEESVRFKEIDTDLLYDCQMLDEGVLVRQCYPNHHNLFLLSFEAFLENFEESFVSQGELFDGPYSDYDDQFADYDEDDEGDCS